jgi:hypothetical protein
VAVGLAFITAREGEASAEDWRKIEIADLDAARSFLERLDKDKLVEIILRKALDSERMCERLLEAADEISPRTPDL